MACLQIVDEVLRDAGGKLKGSDGVSELKQRGCLSKFIICSASIHENQKSLSAGADVVWPKPLPALEEIAGVLRGFLRSEEDAQVVADIRRGVADIITAAIA